MGAQPMADQDLFSKAQALEVVQKISLAQNPQGLLEAICHLAVIKEATQLAIMLFEPEAGQAKARLKTVAKWALRSVNQGDFAEVRENLPFLWVMNVSQPVIIEDIQADDRLDDELREGLRQVDAQSLAAFALMAAETHLGWLLIEHETPKQYTLPEISLLETLARQTATVLHNQLLSQAFRSHTQKQDLEREHLNRLHLANGQQRARQIETGAEISKTANSILDPETLVKRVVNLIRDGFDLYYVGLFLVDEAGAWAILRAGTGEAGAAQLTKGHKLPLDDQSMIGWCITHQQARINLDVGDDAIWFDNPYLPLTRSEMALPLITRNIVMGAITIQSAQPAAFSQDDIVTLQIMADQIANALLNAQAFQTARQRADELNVLLDINRDISASVQLDKLLNLIIARATEIVKGDQGTVFLLEDEALVPRAIVGGLEEILSLRIPLGDGATGQAALERRPVFKHVEDPETVKHIPGTPLLPETMLAVPIQTKTNVIGVLLIRRNDITRRFTEAEVTLLEAIALQAAIAVENASSLTRTQQAQEQTERLYQIGRQFAVAEAIEELAGIVAHYIPQFSFDRVLVVLRDEPDAPANPWAEVVSGWDKDNRQNEFLYARFSIAEFPFIREDFGREYIIIEDINTDPLLDEQTRQVLKAVGTKSIIIAAIRLGDKVLGWLVAETKHQHKTFTQSEPALLLAVANQLGTTIDRIQKTAALVEAGQQFSTMVDNIPGAVYHAIFDQYYRFQYLSDDITDITGYPVEAFLDQANPLFHQIIHPEDYNRVLTTIRNQINRQEPYRVQYRIITKTGESKYISERGRGTFDERKNIFCVDGVLFDVTDREILQRAFQRRAMQFEAIVQVGQEASAILDVERLIWATVKQISQTFGFYYAGLFLLDHNNEWAMLKAGSGEAGQKMVAERHRLKRDEASMVGWATYHGKARIAPDVGVETQRFSHPYLPLTRSEIALPLIARTQVIGALDVQSEEQNAFSDDDITTLQLMANQLANVIENARLFETTEQNWRETDLLYRTTQTLIKARSEEELFNLFIEKTAELGADSVSVSLFAGEGERLFLEVKKIWTRYSTPFRTGQRYELKSFFLEPLITQPKMFVIQDVNTDERLTDFMRQQFHLLDAYSIVIIPIIVQEPVGTVHITYKRQPRTFTETQIRLFESMVQQLTLIWQNLRLLASLERQFRQERIIREISGKVHATTGVDQILQTTILELSKALHTPAGVARLKINHGGEVSSGKAETAHKNDTSD